MWRKMKCASGGSTSDESDTTDSSYMSADECGSSGPSSPTGSPRVAPIKKLRSALNLHAAVNDGDAAKAADTRTMRFSSTVHICLVLSRTELKPLMTDLFWKPEDYVKFKSEAVNELRAHLTANGISAKEAIFELYQPHHSERLQWMADYEEHERQKEETDGESSSAQSPYNISDEDLCDLDEIYNSEDDDEPRLGSDVAGLKRFSSLKTDIELNAIADSMIKDSTSKMPTKTPSGGGTFHQWAVSWKPKKHSQ